MMKIGLLTFHRAYNCGAMLQAWALQRVLERMGHTVAMPSCNRVGETPRWRLAWTNADKRGFDWIRSLVGRSVVNLLSIPMQDVLIHRYRKFRKAYLNEDVCTPVDFGKRYDVVMVGSDQVWNDQISKDDAPLFFGENLPRFVRKIAYAASCGDELIGGARLARLVSAANRFEAVSVRERLAKNMLCERIDKPISMTLDPTLLLCDTDYDEIASQDYPKDPYLFMYTVSGNPFLFRTARELARRMGVRCVIAPCYQYGCYHAEKGVTYAISPDRLVSYSKHAKYVVAESFHGTIMGVLFNKPTISLRTKVDQTESRPASLLNALGCGGRVVNPETSLDSMEDLLRTTFSSLAYEKLGRLRAQSIEWIKAALSNQCTN